MTPATGRRDLAQAASDTAVRDSGTPACCHAAAATRRPGRGRRVRVAGAAEVTVTGYVSAGRPCWVAAGQCHVGPGAATVLRRLPWPSGAAAGRPPLPRSVLVTAAAGGRRGPALAAARAASLSLPRSRRCLQLEGAVPAALGKLASSVTVRLEPGRCLGLVGTASCLGPCQA